MRCAGCLLRWVAGWGTTDAAFDVATCLCGGVWSGGCLAPGAPWTGDSTPLVGGMWATCGVVALCSGDQEAHKAPAATSQLCRCFCTLCCHLSCCLSGGAARPSDRARLFAVCLHACGFVLLPPQVMANNNEMILLPVNEPTFGTKR